MNRAQAILNWLRTQGVRWLVAAVIAAVIWRLWCLLHPSTEAAEVLLTVLAGGGGLCVASLNSDGQRLVSNALVGILVALLFYCGVRGVLVKAAAPASSVQACGVAAMIFLVGASRLRSADRSAINRMAGKGAICLAGLFGLWGAYSALLPLRRLLS